MKSLNIAILIGTLLSIFSLYDLGLTYYESIIAQFSIAVASVYFILNIGNFIDKQEVKYYILSVLIFVIISTILFSKNELYRISQYLSISLMLANLYALSYLWIYKIVKHSNIRQLITFIILILFISGAYGYSNKNIKTKFDENEALKDIYIEAGAIMNREVTYYYLNKIKDCDKFKVFQKQLIKADKELKNNEIIKSILDKKIRARDGKIIK